MNVNIALLTVTDTRTIDTDKSGAILVKKIKEQKHKLIDRKIVKDNKDDIKKEAAPKAEEKKDQKPAEKKEAAPKAEEKKDKK